jgi:hypothetical protein
MRVTVAATAVWAVCGTMSPAASQTFTPTVRYDTVAVVGGTGERNPLFVYENPHVYLLDSATVAYADGKPVRIVVANLLTGQGWERRGAEGADDFQGQSVFLSPFAGVVHAVGFRPYYAAWSADGQLVSARNVTDRWSRALEFPRPLGVFDGRIVVEYSGFPTRTTEGLDTVPHGLRLYHVDDSSMLDVRAGIPDMVMRAWRESGSTMQYEGVGDRVVVAARGQTMVRGAYGGRALTALDASGRTIATRELDVDLATLTIDADGRIWARTSATDADGRPGSIVLTPDLSAELFRVAAVDAMDASGDFLVAMGQGRVGPRPMVLLRMRPLDPSH